MSDILRIWRGRTSPDKARAYEELLRTRHLPSIAARRIHGLRSIEFGKRQLGEQIEFVTAMRFASWPSVIEYAGANYQRAAIASEARALLDDADEFVAHFELVPAAG